MSSQLSYPVLSSLFPSAICLCFLGLQSLVLVLFKYTQAFTFFLSLHAVNALTMLIIVLLNSVSISCKLLSLGDITIELVVGGHMSAIMTSMAMYLSANIC